MSGKNGKCTAGQAIHGNCISGTGDSSKCPCGSNNGSNNGSRGNSDRHERGGDRGDRK